MSNKNFLKILNWNIQGIYNKKNKHKQNAFFNLIHAQKPDIITLQEWSLLRKYTNTMRNFKNPFQPIANQYKIYFTETTTAILVKNSLHQVQHMNCIHCYENEVQCSWNEVQEVWTKFKKFLNEVHFVV